jgi:hypothetical protein
MVAHSLTLSPRLVERQMVVSQRGLLCLAHGVPVSAPSAGSTVCGVVLVQCILEAWLTVSGVGAFQEYYQNDLLKGNSPSTIAWIPSLQIFFIMGTGPIIGKLYDSYGPRYLILGGSFLHVFGLMMASISTEYYQILLSQGVCSAIGVSAIFQPGKIFLRILF